jgi:type II secretory pathway component PulC
MTKERTDGVQNIPASDNAAAQGKAPAQPEESSAVRPVLKISGIVWQEERSERKAMINNTVAREGDTVEGAKILEIHPSHVLVSFKGQSFKVTMFE